MARANTAEQYLCQPAGTLPQVAAGTDGVAWRVRSLGKYLVRRSKTTVLRASKKDVENEMAVVATSWIWTATMADVRRLTDSARYPWKPCTRCPRCVSKRKAAKLKERKTKR